MDKRLPLVIRDKRQPEITNKRLSPITKYKRQPKIAENKPLSVIRDKK